MVSEGWEDDSCEGLVTSGRIGKEDPDRRGWPN